MASVIVRGLSDEIHRALNARAAEHGRSTEAEIRAILEEAVRPDQRLRIGSALLELGRRFGGVDLDSKRDKLPIEPAAFE